MKKIVVTGMSGVSPIGNSVDEIWNNASNGVSGIGPVTKFDVSGYRCRIAGEVKGYEPGDEIPIKERKKMDTFIHYALSTTARALKDSGLEITDEIAEEVGVIIGTGIGGLPAIEKFRDVLRDKGENRVNPFFIPMSLTNMASGQVSIFFNAKSYNATITSACATSNHSIGDAAKIIERGDAKVMIAGGTEAAICPLALAGFSAMKALANRNEEPQKASRPYDVNRNGFVLAEGCGILILEEEEFAKQRGAEIICRLSGYGFSSDAHHMTAPSVDGPSRAMKMAMKDARVSPDEIDYVNAHGTSTPLGDINELNAIKQAFGPEASKKISISSSKSMTGHLLGGTGGIEAIIAISALRHSVVPPTINVDELDPACDLDVTPNVAKEKKIKHALSNCFGFGGSNGTLIFSSY